MPGRYPATAWIWSVSQLGRQNKASAGAKESAMTPRSARLIFVLDLSGTFVFAVEGAALPMAARLDVFGVMVISFVTALGGGMLRDVLIASPPPQALRDWRYPMTAFSAGLLTFAFYQTIRQIPGSVLMVLDAGGLALFAIAGAEKSLALGINLLAAVLMGGVLRDMLLSTVPAVLRTDIYATAALAGALVLVAGQRIGLSSRWAAALGLAARFGLRLPSGCIGICRRPPEAAALGVASHVHRGGIFRPADHAIDDAGQGGPREGGGPEQP
jgi:uncharacterized membrane protein YeiH